MGEGSNLPIEAFRAQERGDAMKHFGQYQDEIYLAGLHGVIPKLPIDMTTLEKRAMEAWPETLVSYVQGGCGDERTQDLNVAAFAKWGLVPRMMVDSSKRDLSIELFGIKLPTPIFMAPIGVIGICAQDGHGDLATAKAAARTGVPMVASTLTVDPLEAVAAQFGSTPGFFQLYTPTDRELAESFVRRAEAAGFKGIVVTLDTWIPGWRPRDLSHSSFPQLRGHCLANYFSDPVFRSRLAKPPEQDPATAIMTWTQVFGKMLTWADLPWLRSLTKLPLLLKGICHSDDVRRAIDGGIDGIYCSTHGGRQANGGIGCLDMLPAVVEAAGKTPVLFDSGVRTGSDIVKALALGATAVGIGRPYAWGLALDGTDGIVHVLRCLLAEADLLMAIDGYPTLADLRSAGLMKN
jgi:lactate 2-monooxygenase